MSESEFTIQGVHFGLKLIETLADGDYVQKNIIVSPLSVQTVLALAFLGADGEASTEIAKAAAFTTTSVPEVTVLFNEILKKYDISDLVKIASKVYVKNTLEIRGVFVEAAKNYFAETDYINFAASTEAAAEINAWVKEKTSGKINQLVTADNINVDTAIVLLNAIHFKGLWEKPFDTKDTFESEFYYNDNEEDAVKTQFMLQEKEFLFADYPKLGCTGLEMNYADSDLSMFVLVPTEYDGLKSVIEKLMTFNLLSVRKKLHKTKVQVKFPKFKIDYSLDLKETLKKLGVKKIFESAKFTTLLNTAEEFCVSNVFHKASVEVNEEGCEAGAATGLVAETRCMPPTVEADRPFLYFIWNGENLLFAGTFVNPKAANA